MTAETDPDPSRAQDAKTVAAPEQHKTRTPLVTRSAVPAGLSYKEYRPVLRHDFFFMCAYCTMMEAEATGIPFDIDHYEPVSARPELRDDYQNLIYACEPCNVRKGDRLPPPSARQSDIRFFRPDVDVYAEHFELKGIRVEGKTPLGDYTVDAVDLNRTMLTKLRELRKRSDTARAYMLEGIAALRNVPLDRLPPQIRGRALSAREEVCTDAEVLTLKLDDILREEARSALLDRDHSREEAERQKERRERLKAHEIAYRGDWRGRDA